MSASDLPELVLAKEFLDALIRKYGKGIDIAVLRTLPDDELSCIEWALAIVNEAKN